VWAIFENQRSHYQPIAQVAELVLQLERRSSP
jgi:hypothetical protein